MILTAKRAASFLIDRMTNNTIGLGLIDFALRRAGNIHWQALDVDRAALAQQKEQKPAVLWFTRAVRIGQVDDCQRAATKTVRDGQAHICLGWRQCPPWP